MVIPFEGTSTTNLQDPGDILCATYNAAGISSITLLTLPKETTAEAAKRI